MKATAVDALRTVPPTATRSATLQRPCAAALLTAEQGRRTAEEALIIPYDSANVYYEFDEEYWNDELHSYRFFIVNRCFESGAQQ